MRWLLPLLAVFTLAACGGSPQVRTHGHVDKLTTIDHTVGSGAEATRPGRADIASYLLLSSPK